MKDKMVIAVISTYDWIKKENNYGSIFQYYALQEFLKSKGHEVYWIKYDPYISNHKDISNNILFVKKIIRKLRKIKNHLFKNYFFKLKNECSQDFNIFVNENLNLSSEEYRSWEQLLNNPPNADVYITGSDQVWLGLNKANYLEFVPKDKKRFSYGASFGRSEFSSSELEEISVMLSKFDKISVREKDGINICNSAGRFDIVQVVDPTFLLSKEQYVALLNQWFKLKTPSNPYIFSYFLNIDSIDQVHWEDLKRFSKQESLQLAIVPVQGAELLFPKKYVQMPSPSNWIKLIYESKYVVTNSFHGTLFSIIMEKPFLVILQKGRTSVQNSRFHSFLQALGLESRIFDIHKSNIKEQLYIPINWSTVNIKKKLLTDSSKEFLSSCGL